MRRSARLFVIAAMFVSGLAATHAVYAQDSRGSRDHGSMMRGGMMDQGGMTGQGGMMGMMEQMSQMMDHCSQMGMMGNGSGKPNEQWRRDAPATPEKKG